MSVARLDSQLCFALYSASSHLTAIYRPLLDPLGLTYTQFMVLMALWEKDDISITQVARRAGLSKATMTPLMKRLEEKQLIERQIQEGNERQKNVVLTLAGRKLSEQSGDITRRAFCASGLSEDEAELMITLSNKMLSCDQ